MCLIIIYIALLSVITDVSEGTLTLLPEGITLHKGKVTWDEARDHCRGEGGVLASPINAEVLSAMKSVIGEYNITYFIGIKAIDVPGQFISIEGVQLENMPLAVTLDMVQDLDQWEGECLAMSRDSIRSVPCKSRLPYMCYSTRIFNISKTNCGPENEGYKYDNSTGNCYKYHTKSRRWEQALMACVTEGAYLVILKNAKEAQIITKMIDVTFADYIYIGVYRLFDQNDHISIHGQPIQELYDDWFGSSPRVDDWFICGALHKSGKWQNINCDSSIHFVCQKEATI